jgi:hypothetical protein
MLAVMLAWAGLVLFPNPTTLFGSLGRLARPPVDAKAVAGLAAGLPRDSQTIELFVAKYVPYKTAWELYDLPWYFPTVAQVVRDKAGDCQAQAILTASILQAKGLPYTFRYSFDHVWVDYPGRQVTQLEDPATAFVSNAGKGWLANLPNKIPLRFITEVRIRYHWEPMPPWRKALLLLGVLLTLTWGERLLDPVGHTVARTVRRLTQHPAPGSEPSAPA